MTSSAEYIEDERARPLLFCWAILVVLVLLPSGCARAPLLFDSPTTTALLTLGLSDRSRALPTNDRLPDSQLCYMQDLKGVLYFSHL